MDSVVTDPPYELGFMGKSWDSTGIAYRVDLWEQVLRVLKPGGHLLAFSGSRTYHRMAVAIEDAGFQIRDQIMWVYGSGFPKSLDVSKAFDKAAGAEREVIGKVKLTGTARKSTSHSGHGAGSVNQSEPRNFVETFKEITAPSSDLAKQWQGWGTALKPAHEPIVMARKPLIGTVAETVQAHGTGAINVDGCRVDACGEQFSPIPGGKQVVTNQVYGKGLGVENPQHPNGRWPANLIHDGSQDVEALFPDGAARFFYCAKAGKKDRDGGLGGFEIKPAGGMQGRNDGSLGSITRRANHHPTVKPSDLMRYLCRLVTPPAGLVLDPFTGSGSTGKAAVLEGFRFVGVEREPEYAEIAKARISHAEQKSISRGSCGQCGGGLPCGNCHTGSGFSIPGDQGQHQPEPLAGPYFHGRIPGKKLHPEALVQLELFA